LSLPPLPDVDKDVHFSIVGTIAQSAAAVLALFFTAISVVASTGYAKLASDVRFLIINDDLNRRYLKLLAHLGAVSVIALVWQALGHKPSPLPTLYIGVLSVLSFLCFFALGARTFALFSPLSLHGIRSVPSPTRCLQSRQKESVGSTSVSKRTREGSRHDNWRSSRS
jgi:hypothetical protein